MGGLSLRQTDGVGALGKRTPSSRGRARAEREREREPGPGQASNSTNVGDGVTKVS
jgi:hypothetical protein